MQSLAIDQDTGEIYIGSMGNLRFCENPGVLLPVAVNEGGGKALAGPITPPSFCQAWVFQEISFEASGGIRRGFLLRGDGSQGQHQYLFRGAESRREQVTLFHYQRVPLVRGGDDQAQIILLTFGDTHRYSVGELVYAERHVDGRELLTVRMRRQFGVLPDLVGGKLPESDYALISGVMEKAITGYRASPAESVIDRCREALAAILGRYLNLDGKDLGEIIKKYENTYSRDVSSCLAFAVNRLHARGKHAEQSKGHLPVIFERDADLAITALGIVLVNLGWGRWSVGI